MAAASAGLRSVQGVTIDARRAALAAVALITAGAAALRLGFAFGSIAPNTFYDAAVRSMSASWHNFFFGAFEPGGTLSIDKAPIDLWFQVASVKLLGFSSWALRLPEALAGIAAVPLLYALVARLFGRPAGLVAAAALAVLPVSVLTARSDTMDSLMMALLVLAALLAVRAGERGRAPLAAGAVLGLAFNVKLFEALVPAPAIAALFVLTATGPPAARLRSLAAGGAAFVAVALAWVTAAGLVPPGSRPYPIGSDNGGVWNVVFGFNGIDRLTAAHPAADPLGAAGPTRLFGVHGELFGSLVGSELLAALVLGALAALVAFGPRRRAGVIAIGTWLVTGIALFSAMGQLHARYLEALTPAIAAALGGGIAVLGAAAVRHRAAAAALALGTAGAVLVALGFSRASTTAQALALLIATALVAAVVAIRRQARPWHGAALTALAAGALLAMPLSTSLSLARAGVSDSGRPGYVPPARTAALSRFLQRHTRGDRYEVVSSSPNQAGALIAHDGRAVLALTRPFGRQFTTPAALARAVRDGQARYALLGHSKCPRCIASIRWVLAHGTDVSRSAGQPRGTLLRLSSRSPT